MNDCTALIFVSIGVDTNMNIYIYIYYKTNIFIEFQI